MEEFYLNLPFLNYSLILGWYFVPSVIKTCSMAKYNHLVLGRKTYFSEISSFNIHVLSVITVIAGMDTPKYGETLRDT